MNTERDDPILNTRELLYVGRDILPDVNELTRARIAELTTRIHADVAELARTIADHYKVTVNTWETIECNEAAFRGECNQEALDRLAEYEGAL